jgi:hypothetical protein
MYLGDFLISLNIFHSTFLFYFSWILELFTYQGAFSIAPKVFDWKPWSISMLEFEAVPHS